MDTPARGDSSNDRHAVSTSVSDNHDATSMMVVSFTGLSGGTGGTVLSAVLELTVASPPDADMLMTVVGLANWSGFDWTNWAGEGPAHHSVGTRKHAHAPPRRAPLTRTLPPRAPCHPVRVCESASR